MKLLIFKPGRDITEIDFVAVLQVQFFLIRFLSFTISFVCRRGEISQYPNTNYQTLIFRITWTFYIFPNRILSPYNSSSIDRIDPPVVRWLNELKHRYEPECMTTLQAKLVAHCCRRSSTIMISESATSAQIFQQKTKTIANEFLKLYE